MSDRRVGIVTINDDTNYGNRLQNFALQEVVRALGWEPETLVNRPPAWDRSLRASRLVHELGHDLPGVARRVSARLGERLRTHPPISPRFLAERRSAIAAFARRYIASSPHSYTEMTAAYWADRYTYAIAGSDQVWNPTYRRAQGIDFIDFMEESRRIAYAASFGVERVPGFLRSRYRTWLQGIPHLSVRESTGRRIVAELTGRDIQVVLDPTLAVSRAVWDGLITDQPPIIASPYAVRFFLGVPTPAQEAWVERNAADAGLSIVDLHALDDAAFADVDPAGFVAAIARAEIIYTDSFHAGIFALLRRRPIVLRSRFERDARWQELLTQHDLRTRPTGVEGLATLADPDWEAVEARRDELRSSSLAFLRRALDSSVGVPE